MNKEQSIKYMHNQFEKIKSINISKRPYLDYVDLKYEEWDNLVFDLVAKFQRKEIIIEKNHMEMMEKIEKIEELNPLKEKAKELILLGKRFFVEKKLPEGMEVFLSRMYILCQIINGNTRKPINARLILCDIERENKKEVEEKNDSDIQSE